ncbi:MAG TPA: PH domain-containing protein [Dermatophilaceae bacterium]|nr:PH domain-containing protein [Dermatophilaceae bacterium]
MPTDALREPAHLVSPRAVTYWTVRALPGWLVLLVGELAAVVLLRDARGAMLTALVLTVVAAAAHLVVMPRWRYRVHRWETTPTAVYTQSGWLSQQRRIAPVSRIQTVDTERGPLEQLFRLANVTVTTASAAGPIRVHGLDLATAEALVAELTEITSRTPDDAT